MTRKAWEGSPRRNASSAKQGRGQKVWSAIKSNPLEDSTGKGEYKGSIRQRGAFNATTALNALQLTLWPH